MVELLEPLPERLKLALGIVSTAGPLFTLVAALIAGGIAVVAYRQRKQADNQAEWWRRAQWALDHAADDDIDKGRIGLRALEHLQTESPLTGRDDKMFLQEVLTEIINVVIDREMRRQETMDKRRWWHKTKWWKRGEADAQTQTQDD